MTIREQIETNIVGAYDVAVCGGGIAGIAAAGEGKKVILFEKQFKIQRYDFNYIDIFSFNTIIRTDKHNLW